MRAVRIEREDIEREIQLFLFLDLFINSINLQKLQWGSEHEHFVRITMAVFFFHCLENITTEV